MLIEISSCAERREYAMHLRGTHCVRSDRKTQISRAQSRWNSGTTKDEGEEAEAVETCTVADAGNVHATTVERSAVCCCWFAAGTEAVECCGVSLAACSTQQHVFCALQQPHLTGTEEVICTVANACNQTSVRLKMMAAVRFMVLSYQTSCQMSLAGIWLCSIISCPTSCLFFQHRRVF